MPTRTRGLQRHRRLIQEALEKGDQLLLNMLQSRARLIRKGKPRPIGFKPAMEFVKSLRQRAKELEGEALLESRQVTIVRPTGRKSLREDLGVLPLTTQEVLKTWPEIARSCEEPKKLLMRALRQGKIQGRCQESGEPTCVQIDERFEGWLQDVRSTSR